MATVNEMLAGYGDNTIALILLAASTAHNVNVVYCTTLGDLSQSQWPDAPEWQRESAVAGAIAHWENDSMTAEQSHESWLETKLDAGWVYGEVKNPNATPPTHPCIKPYAELPASQRAKDSFFKVVMDSVYDRL